MKPQAFHEIIAAVLALVAVLIGAYTVVFQSNSDMSTALRDLIIFAGGFYLRGRVQPP